MTKGKIRLRVLFFCKRADCLAAKLTSDSVLRISFFRVSALIKTQFKFGKVVLEHCFRRVCSKNSKGFSFSKTSFMPGG